MIQLIHGAAEQQRIDSVDMLFTDPPFELSGAKLAELFKHINYRHLVLICSMHQALDFYAHSDGLKFCFDLVVSHITPKKSRNYAQPNMLHSNILYFRKDGEPSAFDRRRVERHDHYNESGASYYPSIFHAPKIDLQYKYQKNQEMINDVLGAFDVSSVCDPFAGSGSTGLAMIEHNITDGVLIERDRAAFELMCKRIKLFSHIQVIDNAEAR